MNCPYFVVTASFKNNNGIVRHPIYLSIILAHGVYEASLMMGKFFRGAIWPFSIHSPFRNSRGIDHAHRKGLI